VKLNKTEKKFIKQALNISIISTRDWISANHNEYWIDGKPAFKNCGAEYCDLKQCKIWFKDIENYKKLLKAINEN